MVHVWTPVGSSKAEARRQLIVDRYIAAGRAQLRPHGGKGKRINGLQGLLDSYAQICEHFLWTSSCPVISHGGAVRGSCFVCLRGACCLFAYSALFSCAPAALAFP
ncbi:hypothetical protein WN982_15380 [Paraburkholderia sp. IMGN_8]|uniref:hypothetical protein n=1 Tax=Paraburkholderia sp. IMGN_8 TaxID=3136564 RepID=UPI0031017DDB